MTVLDTLLTLPAKQRMVIYESLDPGERKALDNILAARLGNPFLQFQDDPIGFVDKIGENIWSKQREIMLSVRDNQRTAVPACHGPGKTHLAARIVAWWVMTHPLGTAKVITTSTTYRQVKNILWPQIRKVQQMHNLAGEVLTDQWKIGDELVAYGFSSGANNEAAVQGEHMPYLLVVVDEAGGISHTLGGALEALMTGGARMLLLGNPPTDEEGSWFEGRCGSSLYNVIRIDAYSTPNFTGEDPGMCRACPPGIESHSVGRHLVDQQWVSDVIGDFGDESAFVEARVFARFPRSGVDRAIPLSWAERATENEDPIPGDAIRLGVDVASDGGDEFVIAWIDGFTATLRHRSSGSSNSNAVDVAGVILTEVLAAEAVHKRRGIMSAVRVKIDALGVGWGVVSLLQRWGAEGKHGAEIVGVKVSESPLDRKRFSNKRAEMWWNGRELLQPNPETGQQSVRLEVDRLTLAQLASPKYGHTSAGLIFIEKKDDIKKRGGRSPDRAEAVLLGLYEPSGLLPVVLPISISQTNAWVP